MLFYSAGLIGERGFLQAVRRRRSSDGDCVRGYVRWSFGEAYIVGTRLRCPYNGDGMCFCLIGFSGCRRTVFAGYDTAAGYRYERVVSRAGNSVYQCLLRHDRPPLYMRFRQIDECCGDDVLPFGRTLRRNAGNEYRYVLT